MYEQYFGFTRTPFRLESEPDMFFFGESQKNVLACITTSLSLRKAIITLSGLPGSGKTTVMRRAIEDSILPDSIICRINRSRCGDFLTTLKQEIFVRQKNYKSNEYAQTSLRELVKNTLDEKKHYLIVVDESQQLTSDEVDELFLLVSIEKDSLKHFKFLLVSHEPFNECFDITKYPNYSQLVSNHCFLLPLLNTEILPYIEHRLSNTGWSGVPSFISEIENIVFLITQGIPRRINSFFDRLMLFSYFESNKKIDLKFIKRFCGDLLVELEQQPHPDLDSFDLRQALRREKRLFSIATSEKVERTRKKSHNIENKTENKKPPVKLPLDEPLSSENPEEILLFVSHFISNPERYKNYTDPYYKLPKNLTLLLCLATETDQYIDDITPEELSHFTAVDIKEMIAVFIEKMLISSRSESSRILGLDDNATEDEINRHFSYMMRLCRSEHLKTDSELLCKKVKDAYIKLLSADVSSDNEIPVIVDVLKVKKKSYNEFIENSAVSLNVQKKTDEQKKEQAFKNEKTPMETSTVQNNKSAKGTFNKDQIKIKINKNKIVMPASIVSFAVAAGLGYLFIGGGEVTQKPDTKVEQLTLPVATNSSVKTDVQKKENIVQKKVLDKKPNKASSNIKPVAKKKNPPTVVAKRNVERKIKTQKKSPNKVEISKNKTSANLRRNVLKEQLIKDGIIDDEEELNDIFGVTNSKPDVSTDPKKVAILTDSLRGKTEVVNPPSAGINTNERDLAGLNTFLIPSPNSSDDIDQQESSADVQNFLENIELGRVISNFKYSYENADIDELTTLFTEKAVSNGGFNREQILDDYELLFDESDSRTIKITHVKWKVENGFAVGIGNFVTSVVDLDEITQNEKEGKISFKVIDVDETKKITELFFLYQFVEAE